MRTFQVQVNNKFRSGCIETRPLKIEICLKYDSEYMICISNKINDFSYRLLSA